MAAKRSNLTRAAVLVAVTALMGAGVTGCGGLGRALGVSKTAPDEFAVVTKAPLVLPPDYELRPPKPGAKRPQELDPTETAKQALFKNDLGQPTATPVSGEQTVLTSTGGTTPSTSAGGATGTDNKVQVRKSEGFANKLLFGEQTSDAAATDEDEKPTITKDTE